MARNASHALNVGGALRRNSVLRPSGRVGLVDADLTGQFAKANPTFSE